MPPPTDIAVPLHGLGVALEWEAVDTSTAASHAPPCQLQPNGPLYSCAAVNEVCGAGYALRWPAGALWSASERTGASTKHCGVGIPVTAEKTCQSLSAAHWCWRWRWLQRSAQCAAQTRGSARAGSRWNRPYRIGEGVSARRPNVAQQENKKQEAAMFCCVRLRRAQRWKNCRGWLAAFFNTARGAHMTERGAVSPSPSRRSAIASSDERKGEHRAGAEGPYRPSGRAVPPMSM